MRNPRTIGSSDADRLNWSALKTIAESPAHFVSSLTEEREETDAMTIGSALHCLALEPFRFADRFAVWPSSAGQRRGREWEAFRESASASGQSILRESDIEDVRRIADAIREHAAVQSILSSDTTPVVEQRIHWTETDETGCVWHFAGTPDLVVDDAVIDIKTTMSCKPSRFGTQAASMMYHGQLAHYARGIELATGRVIRRAYIIAAEKRSPYDVAVFEVLPDDLRLGLAVRDGLLSTLREAQALNRWPGRVPDIAPLRLPAWAYASDAATPEDYDDASSDLEN